ncbi:MAG: hypothetical protein JXR76_03590 [Deltaproteobacteria bacterium]|nr:hypothetical protein [Deltaproteobacteria bacterium]
MLCAILMGLVLLSQAVGCSRSAVGNQMGTLIWPLQGTSASGAAYLLGGATLDLKGRQKYRVSGDGNAGPYVKMTLLEGEYTAALRDGWQLVRRSDKTTMAAQLVSSKEQSVEIEEDKITILSFRFELENGEEVIMGDLVHDSEGIEVIDTATEDTATEDTATEDTATVDTATEDTATEDTETVDTETVDTETVDTATVDTETVDTETVDTATEDTETGDSETGDTETGDTETEDTETEDTDTIPLPAMCEQTTANGPVLCVEDWLDERTGSKETMCIPSQTVEASGLEVTICASSTCSSGAAGCDVIYEASDVTVTVDSVDDPQSMTSTIRMAPIAAPIDTVLDLGPLLGQLSCNFDVLLSGVAVQVDSNLTPNAAQGDGLHDVEIAQTDIEIDDVSVGADDDICQEIGDIMAAYLQTNYMDILESRISNDASDVLDGIVCAACRTDDCPLACRAK